MTLPRNIRVLPIAAALGFLIVLFMPFASVRAQTCAGAIVYVNDNFVQPSQCLLVGDHAGGLIAGISSIRVPAGYTAKVCHENDFTTHCYTLTSDDAHFDDATMNDHVLSVRVTGPPAGAADAAGNPQSQASGGGFPNPLKATSLTELLAVVLHAIVDIGAILLVLAIVWVGFLFVMAQGSEEKIRDARGALMWTVIGGLLLLGAETIAKVIESTVQAL